MKTIKNIALLAFVFLLAFTACKKENDFGGKAEIKGLVTLNGEAIQNATVRLALGAAEKTSTFDAATVTDGSGNYIFKALFTGDYYVTAEYTNKSGQKFQSGGALVTIGDKKGSVQADLKLE